MSYYGCHAEVIRQGKGYAKGLPQNLSPRHIAAARCSLHRPKPVPGWHRMYAYSSPGTVTAPLCLDQAVVQTAGLQTDSFLILLLLHGPGLTRAGVRPGPALKEASRGSSWAVKKATGALATPAFGPLCCLQDQLWRYVLLQPAAHRHEVWVTMQGRVGSIKARGITGVFLGLFTSLMGLVFHGCCDIALRCGGTDPQRNSFAMHWVLHKKKYGLASRIA